MELKIGPTLSALLKSKRVTLRELSKATGVSVSTLSDWSSNRKPDPIKARAVASFFSVSLHYLLFGEDDQQEPIQRILREDFFKGTFEITVKRVSLPKDQKEE